MYCDEQPVDDCSIRHKITTVYILVIDKDIKDIKASRKFRDYTERSQGPSTSRDTKRFWKVWVYKDRSFLLIIRRVELLGTK